MIIQFPNLINLYSTGFEHATRLIQDIRDPEKQCTDIVERFTDLETQVFCLPERCFQSVEMFLEREGMTVLD